MKSNSLPSGFGPASLRIVLIMGVERSQKPPDDEEHMSVGVLFAGATQKKQLWEVED